MAHDIHTTITRRRTSLKWIGKCYLFALGLDRIAGMDALMMEFDGSRNRSPQPSPAAEARKHKLKQLVPAPRSFFMDVKCPGCFTITTVFSHAQTVVICAGCSTVLCQPTGGKARLTEGCSFRRK
ncbi:40S ribosomal protein S27 [Botrytis cinerea]